MLRYPFTGSLFTNDFLTDAILKTPEWIDLDESYCADLKAQFLELFAKIMAMPKPSEGETEHLVIYPILK